MKKDKRRNRTTKSKRIRTHKEKENYKYLGIFEVHTIKQAEMKEKNKKRVSQTNVKASQNQQQLSSRNLMKEINTLSISLVKYLVPFLKGTRKELRQIDQMTRKLMTMHKALHLRNDIDRLYMPRKERMMSRDHLNCNIVKTSKNTKKCTRNLKRLAVTQTPVKDYQLT